MHKKMKSCFAILLALILVLALPSAAFAEELAGEEKSLTIEVVEDDAEVVVSDEETPLGLVPAVTEKDSGSLYIFLITAVVVVLCAGVAAVRIEQRKIDALTVELNKVHPAEAVGK